MLCVLFSDARSVCLSVLYVLLRLARARIRLTPQQCVMNGAGVDAFGL